MLKKKRAKNSCYCLVTWPSLMGDFIVRFIAMRDKNKIASFPDFLDWSVLNKRGVDTSIVKMGKWEGDPIFLLCSF